MSYTVRRTSRKKDKPALSKIRHKVFIEEQNKATSITSDTGTGTKVNLLTFTITVLLSAHNS